ncbi:uncharacterized protein LOC110857334 [Folsomia candida]|uniref:uncharacterized protein LOC110857334 n=1 Tax=Folsomia candida TaxID=158441 RepID=UPI0016054611|nr:uncharacterized protein LOC110857334 [Folsomia candida]XP_035713727.1 uncharacterized protein LOC110857334 [Folsomia candida]
MNLDLDLILGLLIWTIISPVAFPLILIGLLHKFSSLLMAKLLYRRSGYVVSSFNCLDALEYTRKDRGIIGYALRFENSVKGRRLDIAKFRHHFAETFINNGKCKNYPVFYTKFVPVLGYMYKVANLKENLDLCKSIKEDRILEGETENEALSRAMRQNTHFHTRSTQWEIILLRVDVKSDFIIFKFHHALADAYSVRSLLDVLGGTEAPYLVKDFNMGFFQSVKACIKGVTEFARILNVGLVDWFPTGLNARCGTTTLFSKTTVETWKLKEICKNTNSSFLSVITSLHLWSMRNNSAWLEKLDIPENISPHAIITFPQALPGHPVIRSKGRDCCNHMCLGLIKLPIEEDPNPIQILGRVQFLYENYLDSEAPQAIHLMLKTIGMLIPFYWGEWLSKLFAKQPLFETMVNPFPFWETKYQLLGMNLENIYFLCSSPSPIYSNGTLITPLTRGDKTDVTVHASGEVFCSQDEIDEHVAGNLVTGLEIFLMESRKYKARNTSISYG